MTKDTSRVLVELLKALATDTAMERDVSLSRVTIDRFIAAGLGPLLFSALEKSGRLPACDPDQRLRAASMTSRVLTAALMSHVVDVLAFFQANGVAAVALKGVSYANRYYAEPHLRVMGDVDVLLPDGNTIAAERLLEARGLQKEFPAPAIDYEKHIHSAPLFDPEGDYWIELHRRLIPRTFDASREAPLDLGDVDRHLATITPGGTTVAVFSPEFELVYLAVGWCRDLANGFAATRAQRGLADMVVLLKATEQNLDWDQVLRWARMSQIGACVYVMLSFLHRIDAFDDQNRVCRQLSKQQPYVGPRNAALIHQSLDRHVLTFGNFGRFWRESVNQLLIATLLRKHPAWRNLAVLPANLLFPPDTSARFSPGRLLQRGAKLFANNSCE